ncbi:MAG TPA: biopolymer transporter ExbD [Planctomycetaceae bacterium]|jgi:biopolymer transport protein ExbD|nr:biopolymer transporter ExbD [Planctomycetaceae bacterium]
MRYHRRRRTSAEVELNLAAMLDMAFQLLTFFILTFRPAPIEGQLALNLPPPIPVTNVQPDQANADTGNAGVASTNSLVISIRADDGGEVTSVGVGPGRAFVGRANTYNLHELDRQLRGLFGMQHTPYDQVLIRVAPTLRYEELMKIIDVCTRQKLPDGTRLQKISFTELPDAGAKE